MFRQNMQMPNTAEQGSMPKYTIKARRFLKMLMNIFDWDRGVNESEWMVLEQHRQAVLGCV
jgi:hypothetical protein